MKKSLEKRKAVHPESQDKTRSNDTFQFKDSRKVSVRQNEIQKLADNSSKVAQLKKIQKSINPSQVVQKMDDEEEKKESIGARIARRGAFKKMTRRQQKVALKQSKFSGVSDLKFNRREFDLKRRARAMKIRSRNLWDGFTRPSFTEETWQNMLGATDSQVRGDGVTVYKAIDGNFYPRKRDRKGKEDFITLDHIKNWKEYILSTAEPDSSGEITKTSAKAAYNDETNLQLMSSSANSSKSGPKGKFD